jgi:hypothetical protein
MRRADSVRRFFNGVLLPASLQAWNSITRRYTGVMKSIALLSFTALLIATGCKPSGDSQSPTSTNSNGSVLQAPADYVGALGAAKQTAGKTVDVASLNQAIQMFQVDKGRFPRDLNELVQEKYIGKVPDAPYGMKLDYDPSTGTVKVVNQ